MICDEYHLSPLNIACATGNIDMVQKLLHHGALPDKYSMDFTLTCNRYNDQTVKHILHLLVTQGASAYINIPIGINCVKMTIAQNLAKLNLIQSLDFIISMGCDLNLENNDGQTCLHYINYTRESFIETIKILINNGANPNAKDRHGKTLLHNLCSNKSGNEFISTVEEAIKFILKNGGNVNETDNYGNTPLCEACASKYNASKKCSILIEAGADGESVRGFLKIYS